MEHHIPWNTTCKECVGISSVMTVLLVSSAVEQCVARDTDDEKCSVRDTICDDCVGRDTICKNCVTVLGTPSRMGTTLIETPPVGQCVA